MGLRQHRRPDGPVPSLWNEAGERGLLTTMRMASRARAARAMLRRAGTLLDRDGTMSPDARAAFDQALGVLDAPDLHVPHDWDLQDASATVWVSGMELRLEVAPGSVARP